MKIFYYLLSLLLCLPVYTGCGSDEIAIVEDAVPAEKGEQESVFTYEMFFDSPKPSYEEESSTRATEAGIWEDGDIIFLQFSNNGNEIPAKGIYHKSSDKWTITCDSRLSDVTNATCRIGYGKGINPQEDNSSYSILFDYMTAIFSTHSGEYSCSGGYLSVSGSLKRHGWRMRFKGTPGTEIVIWAGRSFPTYYGYSAEASLAKDQESITLSVKSNGYTDYFLGTTVHNDCDNIVITEQATGITYYRSFDENTVSSGNSYYYTIPASTDLHGWTEAIDTSASGEIDGHEYVDLGLPSGRLWAKCNIGASSETSFGNYYAWGETSPKSYYSWSNYYYNYDDLIWDRYDDYIDYWRLPLFHDAAYVNWGSNWCMPTRDDFRELTDYCEIKSYNLNDVEGSLCTGPNGRSIFFPFCGCYRDNYLADNGPYFWTSNAWIQDWSGNFHIEACYIIVSSRFRSSTSDLFVGMPIRPVVIGE